MKDLASRDVVSRAIYMEIRNGNGVNGQNYVYLDVRPESVNRYAALDGRTEPGWYPLTFDRRGYPGQIARYRGFLPGLSGRGTQ